MVANDAEALIRKSEKFDEHYDVLHELGRSVFLTAVNDIPNFGKVGLRMNSLECQNFKEIQTCNLKRIYVLISNSTKAETEHCSR